MRRPSRDCGLPVWCGSSCRSGCRPDRPACVVAGALEDAGVIGVLGESGADLAIIGSKEFPVRPVTASGIMPDSPDLDPENSGEQMTGVGEIDRIRLGKSGSEITMDEVDQAEVVSRVRVQLSEHQV